MSERLSVYSNDARARISSVPWLSYLQEEALAEVMRLGFPSRYHEDWKYTSPDAFLAELFLSHTPPSTTSPTEVPSLPFVEAPIVLCQGQVQGPLNLGLPAGVVVLPWSEALLAHAEKIKPYLSRLLEVKHGFHALNTAMLRDGLFIYVPAGVRVDAPIVLSHWQAEDHGAVYLRHLVVADEGSSLTLIEDYCGDENTCYFTNTITEIHVGAQASVTHVKLQRESKKAYHVGQLSVKQAGASHFDSHSFSVGGQWVRSDINIDFYEPRASARMNGIYAPGDGQHMDHHTVVTHAVPACHSEQDYKGMLSGHSRAVFNGRVVVLKDAVQTEAKQQNKNLLLSTKAEIDTKPELNIFADDVVCTHGATVGHLDEDALFYLASRGIPRMDANRYLVLAFASENLRLFSTFGLMDWLSTLLNEQLG